MIDTPSRAHPDVDEDLTGFSDDDGDNMRHSFSDFSDNPPLDQPLYEDGRLQMFNDVAKDESLQAYIEYMARSPLSEGVKARLVSQAAAFLSKNYVFSILDNERDLQMAMDDIEMPFMMSEISMTRYDKNVDYLTGKAILQSNINIRLRRSKGGKFLDKINTTRSESISEERMQADKETRSFRQKIPIIGSFL